MSDRSFTPSRVVITTFPSNATGYGGSERATAAVDSNATIRIPVRLAVSGEPRGA
jgi:hypothetical protein